MTVPQFVLGALRLVAVVGPILITAHRLRVRFSLTAAPVSALVEAVFAISLLLLVAEVLGLVSAMTSLGLIAMSVGIAVVTLVTVHPRPQQRSRPRRHRTRPDTTVARTCALIALAVVAAQWMLQTGNAIGSGLLGFDTLWYHMPFAAGFAQSGSVTGVHFTQADPITAYYPANSELFHALGIVLLHGDFLSALLNLLWLAVALLAAWCVGLPWRVEIQTFTAGCLLLGLPVLAATQPGTAFNDTAGLATLLAGLALVVNAGGERSLFAMAGLALGFAAGTKYTFVVPALALVLAVSWNAPPKTRARTLATLIVPFLLTSCLWYLRTLVDVGSPLGIRVHFGPITLPGPYSPIAASIQRTVLSQLEHVSLWTSRFAPGLSHALGVLWFVVLVLALGAIFAGLRRGPDRAARAIAIAAAAAAVAYLLFPTGATALAQQTTLFEVNLRYAAPMLALALMLVPIVVRRRAAQSLELVAPVFLLVLVVAQFAPALWPSQTGRHVAFLIGTALALVVCLRALGLRTGGRRSAIAVAATAIVLAGGVAYGAERHFYARRYAFVGARPTAQTVVYRWAQHVSNMRIALYGFVTQYPLYGAGVTNNVEYVGEHTGDGGYRPVGSCRQWRRTLAGGSYRYLVLGRAPTGTLPVGWTLTDPAAAVVLHPDAVTWVLRLNGAMSAGLCPS